MKAQKRVPEIICLVLQILIKLQKKVFKIEIVKIYEALTLQEKSFLIPAEKYVPEINIFCLMNVDTIKGKRIFEIVHWPFKLPPNQHRPTGPFGWHKWCSLAQPSKGQCKISKILSSLIFSLIIEQNIFFPETYNAFTISEPKFMV